MVSVALLAGLGLVGDAGAQQASTRGAVVVPAAPVTVPSDYVIGPEDMLQISVLEERVALPSAAGAPGRQDLDAAAARHRRPPASRRMQLRDKIAAALAEFMPNPEVSVTVLEVRSYRVSVLGEVQKPGVLQLKAPTTVLEAIALAGGFRDFASPSKIVIFRKDEGGQTQRLRFNYNRAVGAGGEENVALRSGDVVVVP